MPESIKTAGDIRRGLAHLADDQRVEFFINNVATNASFGVPGANGGDFVIDVAPNYTCKTAEVERWIGKNGVHY